MSAPFDPFTTPLAAVRDVLLVSASAGTGKTWMVTHLAARWLLEEDRHPSELLMVTFSRAAASELKARLRTRLNEIGEVLDALARGERPATDGAAGVAQAATAVGLDEMRRRHRDVLAALDAVHARTIHSFAASARPEQETDVVAGAALRRRAVQEVVTRRVTSAEPAFVNLLDALEERSSSARPGAELLAGELARALTAAESAGGVASGRVRLWRDETTAPADLDLVGDLLSESSTRLAALRTLERQVSFDSLIEQLHAEVTHGPSALADRLRDQFSLVVIDEFQDTDALQWEIFEAVFRHGPRSTPLILVGDPKQAIYGFRGGDVSVFQRVQAEVRAGAARGSYELDLLTNFRSQEDLLSAVNGLFLAGEARDWRFSPADDAEPIRFAPLRPSDALAGRPGLFAVRERDEATSVTLFDDVRGVLGELRAELGVAPRDVAILCRRRAVLESLRRDLERHGVRTVSSGTSSVFLSPAATQLRTLLWAMADARNPQRARLLAVTWFATLEGPALGDLRAALARRGVAALARGVLTGDVLGTLRAGPDAERRWTDLEHLFELLADEVAGPAAPERLLQALDTAVADARDELETNDAAQRRVESDAEAVTLMTIHAAKGLQFPVVLVPDVERGQRARGGVSSWTTPQGRAIDAATLLGAKPTQTHAARAELDEDRRLVYVALTRAERILVTWVDRPDGQWPALVAALEATPVIAAPDDAPVSRPTIQRYGDPLGAPTALAVAGADDPDARAPTVLPLPPLTTRSRRWSYSSLVVPGGHDSAPSTATDVAHAYEGAGFAEDTVDVTDAADVADDFATVFGERRGTALGNAVHQVFENAVGHVTADDAAALGKLVTKAWSDHGLGNASPDVVDVVATLLRRRLGPLMDDRSLDSFVGHHATSTEMRFTLPLGPAGDAGGRLGALAALVRDGDAEGPYRDFFDALARASRDDDQLLEGHLTGSLDLVARVGDADAPRFVILDYKTNLLKEATTYEPSDLVGEMVSSGYPLQGLLYAVALHRFLRGRLPGYDPRAHLGGLVYYYVRGAARARTEASGLASWRVPPTVVAAVSDLLDGRHP